jgi:C-terminal processing protease CtpA/Prc
MRSLTFLVLTTSAAMAATSVAAQQPERSRSAESRAKAEARALQVRDSVRARGMSLETEIERLANQLIEASQLQSRTAQEIRALTTRAAEDTDRQQIELTVRRLQTQRQSAMAQYQALRSRLVSICDRDAKPEGYMGITFSAEMSADANASGAAVFRFEENPTVESVEPGSPADRAGVRKGDEIMLIGGRNLVGREVEFSRLLRPNSRLPIRIRRDGDARDMVLLIKERPPSLDNGCPFLDARVMAAFGEPLSRGMLSPATGRIIQVAPLPPNAASTPTEVADRRPGRAPRASVAAEGSRRVIVASPSGARSVTIVAPNVPDAPDAPSAEPSVFVVGPGANQMIIAGATIVRPNADLRDTFGVKSGVLVLDVARGTPAYLSGLKGGDIIVSAGRFSATSPMAIQRAMQTADERQVQLRIVRKQKPQTLTLKW